MESQPVSFGKMLEEARKKADLTRPALGRRIGESRQRIADWENDKNKPSESSYRKIVDALEQILNPEDAVFLKLDRVKARGYLPTSSSQYEEVQENSKSNTEEVILINDIAIFGNIHYSTLKQKLSPDYAYWNHIAKDVKIIKTVEPEILNNILTLLDRQHELWLSGSYSLLEEIGNEYCDVANHLKTSPIKKQIGQFGEFLTGEAMRLQVVNAVSDTEKIHLLEKSLEVHQKSYNLYPTDFRAQRGIAKVLLDLGDYSNSEIEYRQSLQKMRSVRMSQGDWKLAKHEELRAWRGQIDLMYRMGKTTDLLNEILLCRKQHTEILQCISHDPIWRQLDFFMGYCLLGGISASLGESNLSLQIFNEALLNRIKMIECFDIVDERLRENLEWFASKISLIKDKRAYNAAERINYILEGGDHQERLIDKLQEVARLLV